MPRSDIAIIGMAGRFPDAPDVDCLRKNLRQGRESLRPITRERIESQALEPDGRYKVMGYLDDISTFDYEFFGIVPGEARKFSPNMRLLLEEVWHTLESAAIPPEQFRGSHTDVYMTQTDSVYGDLADEDSATLFTGNAPEFIVSRMNRLFDLRGIAVVVDTACSSGLSAVLMACDALRFGRTDYALVCGANLYIFPHEAPNVLETSSPDGRARSYSADANGMAFGETVVCFLLTTIERAQARNHPIKAVVRGGALNNNGAMSHSPSAPNSVMQAQAIIEAAKQAEVRLEDIGFIEGHGSATQLGDSLEVEAFRLALRDRLNGTPPCVLSSIKGNIGHGKSAAPLSGLVKAVLAVQHGELYPAPNTHRANPVLNKPDSPVRVSPDFSPWREEKRLAGIHSYGLSGVNVHLIIENVSAPEVRSPVDSSEWFPVQVSSRRDAGLRESIASLREWLAQNSEVQFPDIAHTACLGRQLLEKRHLLLARNSAELAAACDQWLTDSRQMPPSGPVSAPRIVLLFTSARTDEHRLRELSRQLSSRFPVFRRAMESHGNVSGAAFVLAFQLALHALLSTVGISGALAGIGAGKLVAPVVKGSLSLAQALSDAVRIDEGPLDDLEDRASNLVARQLESGPVVFIQMGPESAFSQAVRKRLGAASRLEVLMEDVVRSMGEIAARLFADGLPISFQPWFEERDTRPVLLPGYKFARTRCWMSDTPKPRRFARLASDESETQAWEREWGQAPYWERRIAEIWKEHLGHRKFGRQDNFFELGGDSLLATRVVRRINHEFGIRCDFEDMFDSPTIGGFARIVQNQSTISKFVLALWRDVLKVEAMHENDNFFDLGGHSLLATEILVRVRRDLDLVLSFDDFFSAPTPAAFANLIEARRTPSGNGNGNGHGNGAGPVHPQAAPTGARPRLTPEMWAEQLRRRENA